MVKDVNEYLLTGSINRKFTAKLRPFSSERLQRYGRLHQAHQKRLSPRFILIPCRKNDLSLDETTEMASNQIIDTAKSLMTEKNQDNHFKPCTKTR